MRASESTKESTLGEKRLGIPGRKAPHYEYNPESLISNGQKRNHMKR
jgi:hypothetical protein